MENALDIYAFLPSPPSRAVLLLAKALGLAFNLKVVNTMAGEQMQPSYLKINPTHTIPAINDNGYILWESRAILKYLKDQYDSEGKFTMKDAKDNGRIEQMLYFEATSVAPRFFDYMMPIFKNGDLPNNEKLQRLHESLQVLNTLLDGRKYAAGGKLTIADFSLAATLATVDAVQVDLQTYSHILKWLEQVKRDIPGYEEINQAGADMVGQAIKSKLS